MATIITKKSIAQFQAISSIGRLLVLNCEERMTSITYFGCISTENEMRVLQNILSL